LTQLGYVSGLIFLTPLGDVLEKRNLLVSFFILAAISLFGASLSTSFYIFLCFSFLIGATAVLVQVLIPFVATLSSIESRGKNLGLVLSGALVGVLISRTLSGFLAELLGWRGVYVFAGTVMLGLALLLKKWLPQHQSEEKIKYSELIISVWAFIRTMPKLRNISITAAFMYASLCAFWVSLVFLLHSPHYNLGPSAAGLFGLVGALSALAANIAGRYADYIGPRRLVKACMLMMAIGYIFMGFFYTSLIGLVIGTILLDLAAQSATVSNQTQIYSLSTGAPTRMNTVYKIFYFFGGAVGSLISTLCFEHWGWTGVTAAGLTLLLFAFISEKIANS
jgi:predicted MFS family arabinose efflux permease